MEEQIFLVLTSFHADNIRMLNVFKNWNLKGTILYNQQYIISSYLQSYVCI